MGFINTLFAFAQQPAKTINIIMEERRLPLALLGFFFGALSLVILLGLGSFGGAHRPLTMAFLFFAFFVFNVCVAFFFASSAHLFLELTTGKGKAAGLFVLIGISEFAKTLLAAYALVAAVLPWIALYRSLAIFLTLLLQLFFILYMMKAVYGLSKLRTFFALLLSFLPSIVSFFAAAFLFFFLIFWLFFK
ncbi:MAG: hypothetical protein LBM71_04345 [Elusimicrobiota bacterium]|jgi:hypothetical protein|nr:hypothetical protein [Elusimicrobiota bacterium]